MVLCIVLSGCASGTSSSGETGISKEEPVASVSETSVSVEEPVVSKTEPATSTEEPVASAGTDEQLSEQLLLDPTPNDSVEFATNLKFGWNLGNTLDATSFNGTAAEISWGMPKTTKEMIDFVREQGFTTIRIPVSWGIHTLGKNYVIDANWMKRVKEIVDWAIEDGFYVIINSHHDCDYYYPSEEKLENSLTYIECIWSQVAETFKDYDEHLIFESMNEPRLMGTSKEWWFSENDPEGIASITCLRKLNQKFVDTVRASGGNNETRYLMVPSHAAAPETVLNKAFQAPADPAGRILISVHAYTPYDFAGNENGYSKWDGSKESEFTFMKRLDTKFIQKGYGVVIGEFGVTNKDNLDDRIAWAEAYTRTASGYGIPCIVWDNGQTGVGAENFGLIDRENLEVFFPELLESYFQYYK